MFDWVLRKQENEKIKEESKDEDKTNEISSDKNNKKKTDNMNLDIITSEKKK